MHINYDRAKYFILWQKQNGLLEFNHRIDNKQINILTKASFRLFQITLIIQKLQSFAIDITNQLGLLYLTLIKL